MADEIEFALFKALEAELSENGLGMGLLTKSAVASGILKRLRKAGFVVVPATSDLLRRGEGVKLHE